MKPAQRQPSRSLTSESAVRAQIEGSVSAFRDLCEVGNGLLRRPAADRPNIIRKSGLSGIYPEVIGKQKLHVPVLDPVPGKRLVNDPISSDLVGRPNTACISVI